MFCSDCTVGWIYNGDSRYIWYWLARSRNSDHSRRNSFPYSPLSEYILMGTLSSQAYVRNCGCDDHAETITDSVVVLRWERWQPIFRWARYSQDNKGKRNHDHASSRFWTFRPIGPSHMAIDRTLRTKQGDVIWQRMTRWKISNDSHMMSGVSFQPRKISEASCPWITRFPFIRTWGEYWQSWKSQEIFINNLGTEYCASIGLRTWPEQPWSSHRGLITPFPSTRY